jgi:hypothetical protein
VIEPRKKVPEPACDASVTGAIVTPDPTGDGPSLKKFLRHEQVGHGDRHDSDGDVGDKDADTREIVAKPTIFAQSAVLHLQHLLNLVSGGGIPIRAIQYPTDY